MADDRTMPEVWESFAVPATEWHWRTHDGLQLRPVDMHTKHLFFTLRMIWNHRMPREMEVGHNIKRWHLTYSVHYLAEAIVRMGRELAERHDLPLWMHLELEQMADHLRRSRQWIEAPLLAIEDRHDD